MLATRGLGPGPEGCRSQGKRAGRGSEEEILVGGLKRRWGKVSRRPPVGEVGASDVSPTCW